MILRGDSQVGVVDGRHGLNLLRSLYQSTELALQSVSDLLRVRYISRGDGTFL